MIEQLKASSAKIALASLSLTAALCGGAGAAGLTYQSLPLTNTWERYSLEVGKPAVALDANRVVHLRGALGQTDGTAPATAFILPPNCRPSRTVYVTVTMVNGTAGRLNITPDGTVGIQSSTTKAAASAFTSLEGVTFPKGPAVLQFQSLKLINGWERYSISVAAPAAAVDSDNIVHLIGGIMQTSGAVAMPFVLPAKFRPNRDIYIQTNMLAARPGRIDIHKDGTVFMQGKTTQSDAQQFTSLEGISFSRN